MSSFGYYGDYSRIPIQYPTAEEQAERDKKRIEKERKEEGIPPKKTKGYTSNRILTTLDDTTCRQLKKYCEDTGLPRATAVRHIIIDFLIENHYRRKRVLKEY